MKSQKSEVKSQKSGFTLIEILVVVGILGIIAVIGSNMFFTVFRGSTKTKVLTTVKQNGDYALSVIGRMVRNSSEILKNSDGQVCTLGMKKIKIKNPDKGETEFACLEVGTVNGRIASNSAQITSDEVKVDNCSFDCSSSGQFYPETVTISFTLSQNIGAAPRPEEEASMDFKTTVSIRNY